MKSSRQSASRLAVAASCLLAMQPAFAQIEEIVVTAQRREENQQQVPISISTATAAVLESAGVQSTDELGLFAPGLTIQRQIGSVLPYIRGIGNPNTSGGQESAVAMYVDGIYYAQLPSTNFSLNNIERIEVLKGPQGTLFGRNSTGGLMNLITRTPGDDPTLEASVGYGSYSTATGKVYASAPLGASSAISLSGFGESQDRAWGRNITTGADVGSGDKYRVRANVGGAHSPWGWAGSW